jgi:hypothetical protein
VQAYVALPSNNPAGQPLPPEGLALTDLTEGTGLLQLAAPARLMASATVHVVNPAGAASHQSVWCRLWLDRLDTDGGPAFGRRQWGELAASATESRQVSIPVQATLDVAAGTYNVGVRCAKGTAGVGTAEVEDASLQVFALAE